MKLSYPELPASGISTFSYWKLHSFWKVSHVFALYIHRLIQNTTKCWLLCVWVEHPEKAGSQCRTFLPLRDATLSDSTVAADWGLFCSPCLGFCLRLLLFYVASLSVWLTQFQSVCFCTSDNHITFIIHSSSVRAHSRPPTKQTDSSTVLL